MTVLPAEGLAPLLEHSLACELRHRIPDLLIHTTVQAAVDARKALSPRVLLLARRVLHELASRRPRKASDTRLALLRQGLQPKRGEHE